MKPSSGLSTGYKFNSAVLGVNVQLANSNSSTSISTADSLDSPTLSKKSSSNFSSRNTSVSSLGPFPTSPIRALSKMNSSSSLHQSYSSEDEETPTYNLAGKPTTAVRSQAEDFKLLLSTHSPSGSDGGMDGNTLRKSPSGLGMVLPTSRDNLSKGPSSDSWGTTIPILSYCCASITMTVTNKFVVSGTSFNMTFLLITIQALVCVICVIVCKKLRIITFRDFDRQDAIRWAPISFLLVLMLYSGAKSIQYLKVSVYTIFKNLGIIMIAYGEVLWFGSSITPLTLVSFGLMVLSSVIAAWNDISQVLSDYYPHISQSSSSSVTIPPADAMALAQTVGSLNAGYFWMLFNCVMNAAYVLTMRKRIKSLGFKDWDTMFYNNLLSIPVMIVFSFSVEDWSSTNLSLNFPEQTRTTLISAMIFSGAAAVFISYSTAWCLRATSSTTYSMAGALNKLPLAASGMIFFGEAVTVGSVGSIGAGFVAGLVYSVAKNNQSKQKAAAAASLELKSKT